MNILIWIILIIIGLVILAGLSWFMGWLVYLLTKYLLERKYKPEYDKGRRLPEAPGRTSKVPGYLGNSKSGNVQQLNVAGSPRHPKESPGNRQLLERFQRAFRKT